MNLVNVSEGAYLAMHGLALIAENSSERMNVKVLAEKLHASQAHLAKVFQKLHKAGLVDSVRGPAGGFNLHKPAEDITFLDIYEIIDGQVNIGKCPLGKDYCVFKSCIFTKELNRISRDIYETFKKTKLSSFYNK